MIEFLNDSVRTDFHLLPVDRQKELTDFAEQVLKCGQVLKVLYVEKVNDKVLEVSIRIDKKFDNPA